MVGKLIDIFKNPENFSILLFLVYVVTLTQIMGFFLVGWCWKT